VNNMLRGKSAQWAAIAAATDTAMTFFNIDPLSRGVCCLCRKSK
jgi:hypothetical protein